MAAKKTAQRKAPDRKSEVLSLRIDPRLKYGLDLLARQQRRSVTGVVEWVIGETFRKEPINDADGRERAFSEAVEVLWSENELERLLKLWFFYPSLLSYEESRMVNVLLRSWDLWVKGANQAYNRFKWFEVLPKWELLKPVLEEAAQRPVITGLTDADYETVGLEYSQIPF